MAIFTMTPAMVDGLKLLYARHPQRRNARPRRPSDQDISDPKVGDAISHHQIVDMWESLFRVHQRWDVTLETFMKGSKPVFPPLQPAPEPTEQFKALMRHLQDEKDRKEYELIVGRTSTAGLKTGLGNSYRESVAEFSKTMKLVGNVVFSLLGVPGAVFAIAHSLCGLPAEWSLILTTIAMLCTIVLEIIILNQQDARAGMGKQEPIEKAQPPNSSRAISLPVSNVKIKSY